MVSAIHQSARLMELLAGEAADDLTPVERGEIEALKARLPTTRRDDFMRAAALAQLAFLSADPQAARKMPAALEARLMTRATAWTRLAAGLLCMIVAPRFGDDAVPISEQRGMLLRSAADALQLEWQPSSQPGYAGVRGDVVWSNARQQGYLRLASLPLNDPATAQYQLWIIDPERDARPVDGGVFDVSSTGEVVVPIQAKLAVIRPGAFAITLEKPGGVVVSTQPLLVIAAVGG